MRWPGTGELIFIFLMCLVVFVGSKVNPMGDALAALWRRLVAGEKVTTRPSDHGRS
jgi:hypothetical protein